MAFVCSCTKEVREGEGAREEEPGATEMVSVQFAATNTLFPNPERGLYTHRGYVAGQKAITVSELQKLRAENLTLVFLSYALTDFIDTPISEQMLTLIQANFDALRKAGLKAVLRFAYSKSSDAKVYDADQKTLLSHIAQLKPLFQKNADVIAVMEAGFIGAWGEWYYSTHYGTGSIPDYNKRRVVLQALLDALPKERMVSLRTPLFKVKMLQIDFDTPLTEDEAYRQTDKARLSHHNDCFLANASDMGTYKGDSDRAYILADSRYTCVGGETCTEPTTYSECQHAIEAMCTQHWSYINVDYHQGILNDWKQKGCFEEIKKRLGYRFILKRAEHPEKVTAGSQYTLRLVIENEGFASPYNPRLVEVLFRSKATGKIACKHRLEADPRFWFAGEAVEVQETFHLSKEMTDNEYEVLLSLPDPAESLYGRPEYSIRFANEKIWEESTGFHVLYIQTVESAD